MLSAVPWSDLLKALNLWIGILICLLVINTMIINIINYLFTLLINDNCRKKSRGIYFIISSTCIMSR